MSRGKHRGASEGSRGSETTRSPGVLDRQVRHLQRDALREAGIKERYLYEDRASEKLEARPRLESCLKALRKGDTLVVWKRDRIGRDLRHLSPDGKLRADGKRLLKVATSISDKE